METTYSRILASLAAVPLMASLCMAQFNIGDKLEQKAKERLERKADRTMDKGLDKTEEGLDKGAKEATKGKKGRKDSEAEDQQAGKDASTKATPAPATAQAPLKAYSKFDFVPGDQLIAFEDFSQDAIGDFPARWNTNNTGEVVRVEGAEGNWFKLIGSGIASPEYVGVLPEHFTLEYDAIVLAEGSASANVSLTFHSEEGGPFNWAGNGEVKLAITPRGAGAESTPYVAVDVNDAEGSALMSNSRWLDAVGITMHPPISRISVQRQKNRLRLYLNEQKIWDLPRAFADGINYRFSFDHSTQEEEPFMLSNLRVAVGAPDLRSKLITDGRLVTRGILFDSGKDQLRPESYGTLKEIASVLQENASVKVRIIGHTDSDGNEAKNLDLSKRRAVAVKEALTKEFKVDAARMQTDGKGQGEPASPNDTPQGKANNRRVEFVKL